MKFTEDDNGILYRALVRHANALEAAAERCAGSLYPDTFTDEADRTRALFTKIFGKPWPAKFAAEVA